MLMPEGALELSVRWSRGRRRASWFAFAGLVGFILAWTAGVIALAVHQVRRGQSPGAAAIPVGLILLALIALLLLYVGFLRFRVWLHDGVLLVQGWRTLRSIPLQKATFRYGEPTWTYLWRQSPARIRRASLRVPTLIVSSKRVRRVAIPLVRRDILPTAQGAVAIHWLPPGELTALADAIESVATAANKDRVIRFLRAAAGGSPLVRPTVEITRAWPF